MNFPKQNNLKALWAYRHAWVICVITRVYKFLLCCFSPERQSTLRRASSNFRKSWQRVSKVMSVRRKRRERRATTAGENGIEEITLQNMMMPKKSWDLNDGNLLMLEEECCDCCDRCDVARVREMEVIFVTRGHERIPINVLC